MRSRPKAYDRCDAAVVKNLPDRAGITCRGQWRVRCYRPPAGAAVPDRELPDQWLVWEDSFTNLVVNEGLNHLLSVVLAGGAQVTTWYVGLTAASPVPAAADTMASHAGWTEWVNYSEASRQQWVPGTVSGQQVSNSGNKARFTSNAAAQTVGGAFLVSNNTKNGTTGTLYAVGAFSGGNKTVGLGEIVEVTYTFSAADDGV